MEGSGPTRDAPLDAGGFGRWLADAREAIRAQGTAEVPCGSCTACCTSSQFVHVSPDETETLTRIPAELLVAAPGLPEGHVVMGYDERGHCPMLVDGACSIYEHRPRTCRTYDCRIFAATGVEPDGPAIALQVRGWRFSYDGDDRARHQALRAAAATVDGSPTERAIRAFRHEACSRPSTGTR